MDLWSYLLISVGVLNAWTCVSCLDTSQTGECVCVLRVYMLMNYVVGCRTVGGELCKHCENNWQLFVINTVACLLTINVFVQWVVID